MSKKISILVPVYNAEETLKELVILIEKYVIKISNDYEIILVDDCSLDNSWKQIKELGNNNKRIIGVKLTKNYGLDVAITAGIERALGDYICIMFCDLQDPIDKMPDMYEKLISNKDFDIICAYYKNKHLESYLSNIFSTLFWKLFSLFIDSHYPAEEGLYRIITRKAANFYLKHNNKFKHIKILHNTGIKKTYINLTQNPRSKGTSGFTIKKKIEFAIDYLTTYSHKPLLYSSFIGLVFSFISIILACIFIILKLIGYVDAPLGWTSLIVIISVFFSLVFLNLSLISIYLSKNIEESINSDSYFVDEYVNYE